MRRRLFNLLTVLSVLLCVAVCVLWARSYRVSDQWIWRRIDTDAASVRELYIDSRMGRFRVSDRHTRFDDDFYASPSDMARLKGTGGLWHGSHPLGMGDSTRVHRVGIPHWVLLPLLAALPTVSVRRRWTERRRATLGRCASCGYDLRATPGRCPECSTMAALPPPL